MNIVSTANPVSERNPATLPGSRVSLLVAIVGSSLIHTLVFFSLASISSLPSVGFDIELPAEVEFGLTEESKMDTPLEEGTLGKPPVSTTALTEHDSKRATASLETVDVEKKLKKKVKKANPGGERPKNAEKEEDGGVGENSGQSDSGTPVLAAYAPPGAQIALRLDMERVRASPLAAEVSRLLNVVPDWNLILEGSGIDPVADLNRLFVASPNLMRSRLVVAGQYKGGQEIAQKAVANLAATQGREANWRSEHGIAVAPWLNRDETERIIALVGPKMFAITRPNDLSRVLAVAKGLADRLAQRKEKKSKDIASALLAMEAGETLSLSVEGARQFVRGRTKGVPSRISVSVKEKQEKEILVNAEGLYDSAEQAKEAKAYWEQIRKRIASHPLVLLVDLNRPLTDATLELNETSLIAHMVLTYKNVRVLFGILENALSQPQTSSRPVHEKKPHQAITPSQENGLSN